MIQPLIILADTYADARAWAIRRGLPSAAHPIRNQEGESWVYVAHLDRLLGRHDGRFVDLRSFGAALGDQASELRPQLLSSGFRELPTVDSAEQSRYHEDATETREGQA